MMMIRSRPIAVLIAALALPLAALTVTACGGDHDSGKTMTGPASRSATTVAVASTSGLGTILVDSQGRTIYLFQKDTGTKSACSGDCAVDWPPVTTTGKATVGGGLSTSKVGTTKRPDGTTQITYNGHPLYLFEGDHGAGDANGQGLNAFGAAWYGLSPAGNEITGSG
jgi:predicted lipoprotein with Yx(FWY)xxD motif